MGLYTRRPRFCVRCGPSGSRPRVFLADRLFFQLWKILLWNVNAFLCLEPSLRSFFGQEKAYEKVPRREIGSFSRTLAYPVSWKCHVPTEGNISTVDHRNTCQHPALRMRISKKTTSPKNFTESNLHQLLHLLSVFLLVYEWGLVLSLSNRGILLIWVHKKSSPLFWKKKQKEERKGFVGRHSSF